MSSALRLCLAPVGCSGRMRFGSRRPSWPFSCSMRLSCVPRVHVPLGAGGAIGRVPGFIPRVRSVVACPAGRRLLRASPGRAFVKLAVGCAMPQDRVLPRGRGRAVVRFLRRTSVRFRSMPIGRPSGRSAARSWRRAALLIRCGSGGVGRAGRSAARCVSAACGGSMCPGRRWCDRPGSRVDISGAVRGCVSGGAAPFWCLAGVGVRPGGGWLSHAPWLGLNPWSGQGSGALAAPEVGSFRSMPPSRPPLRSAGRRHAFRLGAAPSRPVGAGTGFAVFSDGSGSCRCRAHSAGSWATDVVTVAAPANVVNSDPR